MPVCPELESGLGVPRPPLRLVGNPQQPQMVGVIEPHGDVTAQVLHAARRWLMNSPADLCGFILKKGSPSCGMERVKVYPIHSKGPTINQGQGIFARQLLLTHPLLPVEEEGRLNDPVLRENFVNRLFVMQRWQLLQQAGLTPARLIEFHSAHKYLVMAHSQAAYQRLGRQLAQLAGVDLMLLATAYFAELMTALQRRVTRARHCNVLQHILGYLKLVIDTADKRELLNSIEAYRRAEIPLIVPITLLRHYFRRHPDPYLLRQVYFAPHPDALGLRNAI